MSENNVEQMGFGAVNDQDESLKKKPMNFKFGLNEKVHVTKFEYNPNGGKDGAERDALDINFDVNGSEQMLRLFEPDRVYDSSSGEVIEDKSSDKYKKGWNENFKHLAGLVTQIIKSVGVTNEDIKKAFKQNKANFAEWIKTNQSLLPDGFEEKEVDLFLEYEYSIRPGNKRTFLTVPRNLKGGDYVIVPHKEPVGKWTAHEEWTEKTESGKTDREGLCYKDEDGNLHPFKRDSYYMDGNKANKQVDDDDDLLDNSDIEGDSGEDNESTWS